MKKVLLIGLVAMFLSGCATFNDSEFMKHRAMYKNLDHATFSIKNSFGTFGHYVVDPKDYEISKEQEWWGITVTPKAEVKKEVQTGNHKK